MKKLTASLFILAALLLAGCASMSPASQKSAIESVLARRADMKAKADPMALLTKQSTAALASIDVSPCPADFQAAWFDYVIAVENLQTRMDRIVLAAEGAGHPVTSLPELVKAVATNEALAGYLMAALDGFDNAWHKVERTAMNYDVFPER